MPLFTRKGELRFPPPLSENVLHQRQQYVGKVASFLLPWGLIDIEGLADRLAHGTSQTGALVRLELGLGKMWLEQSEVQSVYESASFDAVYATRLLVDVVPNAWVARGIVADLITGLQDRGLDDVRLGAMSSLILDELRKWIILERDRLAEARFMEQLVEGKIQFGLKWFLDVWPMPDEIETDQAENARQLMATSGGPLGKWKKGLVYPDFIFAHRAGAGRDRLAVWETKGDHLGGRDTEYKRKLLQTISEHYETIPKIRAGELKLVFPDEKDTPIVHCELVLMSDWRLLLDERLAEA